MGDIILYEVEDRIATITLNRPEVLNSINRELRADLAEALHRFDGDDDAWVGIITGAGRAFSAGRDLKERAEENAAGRQARAIASMSPDSLYMWSPPQNPSSPPSTATLWPEAGPLPRCATCASHPRTRCWASPSHAWACCPLRCAVEPYDPGDGSPRRPAYGYGPGSGAHHFEQCAALDTSLQRAGRSQPGAAGEGGRRGNR